MLTVPKPHSTFEFYYIEISPTSGLASVVGVSKDIETDSFGITLKSEFANMEERLSKIYGEGEKYDLLIPGSIWYEPNEWMMSLYQKERILTISWSNENEVILKNDLSKITLIAYAVSIDTGVIAVEYRFTNYIIYEIELEVQEDESF